MFWGLFSFPSVHCDSGAAGGDGGDADDNSGVDCLQEPRINSVRSSFSVHCGLTSSHE